MVCELKEQKRLLAWEKYKYAIDQGEHVLDQVVSLAAPILSSPMGMLISGFLITGVLEHTKVGQHYVAGSTSTQIEINPWSLLFPPLVPFLNKRTIKTTSSGLEDIDLLSKDQATTLRAGLVAAAVGQSGLVSQSTDLISNLLKTLVVAVPK